MSNLTRFDPLDDIFRGFFLRPVDLSANTANTPSIRMDVAENPDAFLVHAELPGVKKEDIHVSIDGAQVSISAEVKEERSIRAGNGKDASGKEGSRILRAERYYGKVSRSFQLAQEIDDAQASARFNDGVLELTLPKRVAAASKRLMIE